MIKMSKTSHDFLLDRYPELLKEEDLDCFLLALDALITRDGLDENDNMTVLGHSIQSIYDEVYMVNE